MVVHHDRLKPCSVREDQSYSDVQAGPDDESAAEPLRRTDPSERDAGLTEGVWFQADQAIEAQDDFGALSDADSACHAETAEENLTVGRTGPSHRGRPRGWGWPIIAQSDKRK